MLVLDSVCWSFPWLPAITKTQGLFLRHCTHCGVYHTFGFCLWRQWCWWGMCGGQETHAHPTIPSLWCFLQSFYCATNKCCVVNAKICCKIFLFLAVTMRLWAQVVIAVASLFSREFMKEDQSFVCVISHLILCTGSWVCKKRKKNHIWMSEGSNNAFIFSSFGVSLLSSYSLTLLKCGWSVTLCVSSQDC